MRGYANVYWKSAGNYSRYGEIDFPYPKQKNNTMGGVIYALRDLFIRFFGKEVEALRAFFIEGGLRQC